MAGLNFGQGVGSGLGQDRTNLTNVDWADTASATGYIFWEAWGVTDSTGIIKKLMPSNELLTMYVGGGYNVNTTSATYEDLTTTFVKVFDTSIDSTPFQLPRLTKGTALMQFKYDYTNIGVAAVNQEHYLIIKVEIWNGSSATQIGTVQTPTATTTFGNTDTQTGLLPIEISTISHFKGGDKLRLSFEVWARVVSTEVHQDSTVSLYHIPDGDSTIKIALPMRIEEK